MEFLQKIMILIAGCNIILAKPSYDYGHESYKSFHVPWAIKYPQPLISIDGTWPISYSYPLSREYDYPYEENNYQQELLTNSLNKALTKLNQLLPHSNLQETTSYPPYTKPEVLAEALNKAIDRLGVLLTRQPLPLSTKTETTTALPMSTKTEATTAQPIKNRQAIMPPEKVSDSVSSAISELNKLFATLPDELKANSTQTPPTSGNTGNIANKPIVLEFQPMRPAPFISQPMFYPELKPNMVVNTKDSSTESTLFTSNHLVEQNKVTEKIDESNNAVVPTTAVPNIASNIGITSENTDDNNIFTTFVPAVETSPPTSETVWPAENVETITDIVVETTVLPTEKNVESTDPSIKNSETDITTSRNEVSSTTPLTIPEIDIRFKEDEARSDFIFPDQFEQMLIQNNKPIVQQEVDLASRFQEQSSTPITLEYKPSRPPFYPDIFPPNPSPRPETDSNPQSSTVFDLADRNKVTTVVQQQQPAQTQRPVQNNQNPQIILEYKPSRPPFHPDVYPPQPSQSPETVSNLQTSTNFELSDRNKPTTVINEQRPTQTQRPIDNNQNTPIVLEYKPSRPSFAPNPIFYPGQILTTSSTEKDGSQTTEASPDLDNRNKIPVTTTTTEIIFTTTQNNQPFYPTHYYSTPISLEYKPTRPFYAPNPIFYPRPIIPPGTPWPASSTERSRN